jgi:hypothetical protein
MGEKGINPPIPEEILRDLFDRQHYGAGREVFGYDDAFPPEIVIGKDADRRGLDLDLQGKLPEKFPGVDGNQGHAPLPRIFILTAYAEAYFRGQISSVKILNYDINRQPWSTRGKTPSDGLESYPTPCLPFSGG